MLSAPKNPRARHPCLSLWERCPPPRGRRGERPSQSACADSSPQRGEPIARLVLRLRKEKPHHMVWFQTVKKASQNFPRKRKTKFKSFSAAACTWMKTHLRLQVWNLFAYSEQIMREADCKILAEKPKGLFRQAQTTPYGVVLVLVDDIGLGYIMESPGPYPAKNMPPACFI